MLKCKKHTLKSLMFLFGVSSERKDHHNHTNLLYCGKTVFSKDPVFFGKKSCRIGQEDVFKSFYSATEFERIRNLWVQIQNLEQVPKTIFFDGGKTQEKRIQGETLYEARNKIKKIHKEQMVYFLKQLRSISLSHRDLHAKNIIVSEKNLFVIDWDFLMEDENWYDINGRGLSPHMTDNTCIFKSFPKQKVPSVADILKIQIGDFK